MYVYIYVIPMYIYIILLIFFLYVAIFKMNYSHFVKYHGRFDKVVHLCIHESVVKMARGTLRTRVSSMSKISEGNQSKCINI